MQNYYIKAFSLLELLIAMIIVALLVVLAAPSYRYCIGRTRAQIYTNKLVSMLEFARISAIKIGEPVIFCGSKDHQSCDGLWQKGILIITENSAKILKVLAPITNRDKLNWHGNPNIIFAPNGFVSGYQGSFYYCPDGATNATVIILSPTGMVRVSDKTHDGNKIPCE